MTSGYTAPVRRTAGGWSSHGGSRPMVCVRRFGFPRALAGALLAFGAALGLAACPPAPRSTGEVLRADPPSQTAPPDWRTYGDVVRGETACACDGRSEWREYGQVLRGDTPCRCERGEWCMYGEVLRGDTPCQGNRSDWCAYGSVLRGSNPCDDCCSPR